MINPTIRQVIVINFELRLILLILSILLSFANSDAVQRSSIKLADLREACGVTPRDSSLLHYI